MVDNSDQESLEMVSIYGGDLFETQEPQPRREGFGGLLGLSASRPPIQLSQFDKQMIRSTTPPFQDHLGSFIMMEKTSSRYSEMESIDDISSPMFKIVTSDIPLESLILPRSILDTFKQEAEMEAITQDVKDMASSDQEPDQEPVKEIKNDIVEPVQEPLPETMETPNQDIPIKEDALPSDPSTEDIIYAYLQEFEKVLDTVIDFEFWFLPLKKYIRLNRTKSPRVVKLVSCLLLAGLGSYVMFRARYLGLTSYSLLRSCRAYTPISQVIVDPFV
jgi:hypothetical protein